MRCFDLLQKLIDAKNKDELQDSLEYFRPPLLSLVRNIRILLVKFYQIGVRRKVELSMMLPRYH